MRYLFPTPSPISQRTGINNKPEVVAVDDTPDEYFYHAPVTLKSVLFDRQSRPLKQQRMFQIQLLGPGVCVNRPTGPFTMPHHTLRFVDTSPTPPARALMS